MKLVRFKNDSFQDDMGVSIETPNIIINKKKKISKFWLIPIILIPLAIILLCFSKWNIESGESIYNKYYNQEKLLTQIRGNNTLYDAFIAYHHKDYKKSSKLFKEIYSQDSSRIEILFYYGLSCNEEGNHDEAIRAFERVITNNDNLYVQQSMWCQSLVYVKTENYDTAIKKLKSIAIDDNNYYSEKSFDLLLDIERFKKN